MRYMTHVPKQLWYYTAVYTSFYAEGLVVHDLVHDLVSSVFFRFAHLTHIQHGDSYKMYPQKKKKTGRKMVGTDRHPVADWTLVYCRRTSYMYFSIPRTLRVKKYTINQS